MSNCASAPTAMVLGTQLQEELVDKASPEGIHEYQSMVGSIMYPMIQTRHTYQPWLTWSFVRKMTRETTRTGALGAANPTPKCDGGAALEVPTYCALDQDLPSISPLQENAETESLTQLNSNANLAGDASQETTGSLLLSPTVEEEISDDQLSHEGGFNSHPCLCCWHYPTHYDARLDDRFGLYQSHVLRGQEAIINRKKGTIAV